MNVITVDVLIERLKCGEGSECLKLLEKGALSDKDIKQASIQESARTGFFLCLARHDVKEALCIASHFVAIDDELTRGEIYEMVRESLILYLKNGFFKEAKELINSFTFPQSLLDDTLKQAILSLSSSGDLSRLSDLRDVFGVSHDVIEKVLEYYSSWNKPETVTMMRNFFGTSPAHS